jgi:hypothetical protein
MGKFTWFEPYMRRLILRDIRRRDFACDYSAWRGFLGAGAPLNCPFASAVAPLPIDGEGPEAA